MAVTQYIGARYVPLFSEPLDWDISKEYEPLTIVYYAGNSYTSRQAVPKNIEITNEDYWALTGNYNAQIEQYRKEVQAYDAKIKANTTLIDSEKTRAMAAEKTNADAIKTEKTRAMAAEKTNADAIDVNADAIKTEKTRAMAAEKANADAIKTEKTRAMAAEKANADAIDKINEKPNIVDYVCPEYIGDFVAYNGLFYGTTGTVTDPFIAQGYCYDGTEHKFTLIDSGNTKMRIASANESSDSYSISTSNKTGCGHANCMAYNPNTEHYYVYTGVEVGKIVIFDKSFTQVKTVNTPTGGEYGSIAFDKKTNKIWFVDYDRSIYEFKNESTFEKKDYMLSEKITTSGIIGQGFAVYDGLAVFPFSGTNPEYKSGFKVFDINTGKFIKYVTTPLTNPLIGLFGEWEDCDFDKDGNLYVSSIKSHVANESSLWYCEVTYLWKTNLYTGNAGTSGVSVHSELYLEPTKNNFRSTGRNEHPFKDVAEWNMFIAERPFASRLTNIGMASNSAVDLKGIIVFDNAVNFSIRMNGENNVTLVGGFLIRAGATCSIQNRLTIKEPTNYPFTYLFRCTNGIVNSYTIAGLKTSKVTNTIFAQGSVMMNIGASLLDGSSNTPSTSSVGGGYGVKVGSPLK